MGHFISRFDNNLSQRWDNVPFIGERENMTTSDDNRLEITIPEDRQYASLFGGLIRTQTQPPLQTIE